MTTPQPSDPIETLGLTARVHNALRRERIRTIAGLTAKSPPELLDIPRFGGTALHEVTTALARHDLTLKQPEHTS